MSMSSFFGGQEGPVDPEAGSGKKEAMASGAMMGSMFGPVGAVIGGALGAVFGGTSSGARMRARRTATQQSYKFGKDAYRYISQGREEAGKSYESKLSYAKARLGASGAELGQSWESAKGHLVRERDTALKGLKKEQKEFRKSESYKWLKEDYEYLGGVTTSVGRVNIPGQKGESHAGEDRSYHIGRRYKGRSNRKMFTGKQYGQLKTYKGPSGKGLNLYEKYAARVTPDMDMFERGQFGSAADKKAYKQEVSANIEAANKWYDEKLAQREAEIQANAEANNQFRKWEPRGR